MRVRKETDSVRERKRREMKERGREKVDGGKECESLITV